MITRAMMLGLIMLILIGCKSQQVVRDDGPFPIPLELKYRSLSKDRRFVYYRIDNDRMLYFGGGRDAGIRDALAVGKLTDEQLAKLWTIIRDHKLLDAKDDGTFADYQKVKCEVKIRAGSREHDFVAVDDHVSGLDDLDKALFDMQAAKRYNTLFQSIDEKIQKDGGAVKKQ